MTDDQDHTNPDYVLGCVLAQIEDLDLDGQLLVLRLALSQTERKRDVAIEEPDDNDPKCPKCGNTDLDQMSVTRQGTRVYNLSRYEDDDNDPNKIWLDEERQGGDDEDTPVAWCNQCRHEGTLASFGIVNWEHA